MTYISEDYLEYYKKYCKIYGKDKTIVFIQVGSFYEAYSTDEEGPDLLQISKLLGVIRSRKNKKIKKINLENPYFLGFPTVSLIKFLEILIDNDYDVIIVDQIPSIKDKKKKKEERCVTNIYSKGTYIENLEKKESNYIVCLYISNDDQPNSQSLMSVGLTGIDVSTGHVYVHEAYSTKYDESYALDEADRFINSIDPKEIIIYYQDNTKLCKNDQNKAKRDKEYIINYLKINDTCRFNNCIDQKYTKLTFQNEILRKVYSESKSFVSPIEQLDLDKNIYAIISLVLIFDFIYDKNQNLLKNLYKPIFFINSKHLILGNNAIRQLDILENYNNNTKCKFKSLFHVINKTSTALGERYLKSRLLSPLINENDLILIYKLTENMMINDNYKHIEKYLDNIRDIERLQRKMELQILHPFEIPFLVTSYENIYELIIDIQSKGTKKDKIIKYLPSNDTIIQIKKFIDYIIHIFDLDELEKYSNLEIKTSIFNEGIYKDIDEIKENVDIAHNFIEQLRDSLDGLIKSNGKQCISIKRNNRDGFYLSLTTLRADILKEKLNKLKIIKVGNKKIDSNLLDFKDAGKNIKIFFPSLDQNSDNIEKYNEELESLNKKYFLQELKNIHENFAKIFKECNNFVANIDFIKSAAKMALLYGYTKPEIIKKDCGYINVKKLRHPIIERIIDYEYVPHDIELGEHLNGILLYGLNASGKSSCMKAVGLSIIMAQSGLYVPAEKFTYSPYYSLYTRITGDDNIFRGLSSFSLEMVEINAILKRADKYTMVIGDEVCRGTEHISGNAIVATTILKLAKTESSFIFATHLHEIMTLTKIKELKNIKAYHLNVSYDEKTKSLIYDRKMTEGTGENIYGITVARYIIQDNDFIDTAMEIKNELLESHESMISGKTSKYNSNIYVYECHLCGKKDKKSHISNLETHHINFQKDCDGNFVKNKKHLKKNQEANLIVLCNECHDKIHNNKIKLNGYIMTSTGKNILLKEDN